MQTFRVELGPASHPVHVGDALLDDIGRLACDAGLDAGRAAIVTDSNVAKHYAAPAQKALAEQGFDPVVIEIAPGESSKSFATLEVLYDRMTEAELDRRSAVFALGGGVVGDVAGLAAATYLRGIAIVQVPTTLVAQVDSALGGKTGVNHRAGKNLIGAFYHPRLVVADVATLKTLPEREFREGLAEVIKYGAIMDASLLTELERRLGPILARDPSALEAIVVRSLRHKAAVVSADEREGGRRRILNYGHTVAHALEASAGYGSYLHGEAVSIGMAAAGRLSRAHAGLSEPDAARIERLLARAGLPVVMPANWHSTEFVRALRLDKKRAHDAIEFVLLDRIGSAITLRLTVEQILAGLA